MRIPRARVPNLAAELVQALIAGKAIEVDATDRREAEADVAAVVSEYVRKEHEIEELAKDTLERRGLGPEHLGRARQLAAQELGFVVGDEAIGYIMDQIIEALLHSKFVAEVFVEDHDLKRLMKPVFAKQTHAEEELKEEVKKKIKNLTEGTTAWEVEYQKALAALRRARGMD